MSELSFLPTNQQKETYEFTDDYDYSVSPEVMKLWIQTLYDKFPNIQRIITQSKEHQQWGDLFVFFFDKRYRAVELKTRRPESLSYFLNDGKILLEKISNIERNTYTSSLTYSKSWWWCYGLTDRDKENGGKLYMPYWWIFDTKKLSEYMLAHDNEYETIRAPNFNYNKTRLLYHTLNWLVPLKDITHLQIT